MIQHISRTKNSDFHIEAIGSQSITLMGPSEIPQTVTATHRLPLAFARKSRDQNGRACAANKNKLRLITIFYANPAKAQNKNLKTVDKVNE